jgi:hypothetical protein
MKLNDRVIFDNINNLGNKYLKYLGESGYVKIIDNLTYSNKTLIGVIFNNDYQLHFDEYCDPESIHIKPKTMLMFEFNLKLI